MIDLRATAEVLEAAWELGACGWALKKIQPGQEVTDWFWMEWVDNRYEKLPVPVSAVPFCLYATQGWGDGEYGLVKGDGDGYGCWFGVGFGFGDGAFTCAYA